MKVNDITVKGTVNGVKKDLGTVKVEEFETYLEAVNYFESQPDNAGNGEKDVLAMINAQHKTDICNAFRVKQLRGPNPLKLLKEKAQKSPEAAAKVAALLAELGIEGEF